MLYLPPFFESYCTLRGQDLPKLADFRKILHKIPIVRILSLHKVREITKEGALEFYRVFSIIRWGFYQWCKEYIIKVSKECDIFVQYARYNEQKGRF